MNSWERYREIKRCFGEEWLDNPENQMHPIIDRGNEQFLGQLDNYLKDISCNTKFSHRLKIHFWGVYYELEIAFYLRKIGLNCKLHECVGGVETDLFLQQENIVIEVTHLSPHHSVKGKLVHFKPKAVGEGARFRWVHERRYLKVLNMERMRKYINRKSFQNVFPTIICFCTEGRKPKGDCRDLMDLINDEENPVRKEISALAAWHIPEITCCYMNPYGRKLELKSNQLKKFFKI